MIYEIIIRYSLFVWLEYVISTSTTTDINYVWIAKIQKIGWIASTISISSQLSEIELDLYFLR